MDLDGIFSFDEEEEPDHLGPPDFRATIHDGELLVTNWAPYLLNGGGPTHRMVRERAAAGVTIADMWLNGDRGGRADRRVPRARGSAPRRPPAHPLGQGRRLRAALAAGSAGDLRVRPAAGFGQGGLSDLRHGLGGRGTRLLERRAQLRPLPDSLRSLQQRPPPVALAAASPARARATDEGVRRELRQGPWTGRRRFGPSGSKRRMPMSESRSRTRATASSRASFGSPHSS